MIVGTGFLSFADQAKLRGTLLTAATCYSASKRSTSSTSCSFLRTLFSLAFYFVVLPTTVLPTVVTTHLHTYYHRRQRKKRTSPKIQTKPNQKKHQKRWRPPSAQST